MKWWFRRPLYLQIFICIFLGIILGLVLGPKAAAIKPLGDIFIRLLKMLIVPLTFFTLISGMTKLEDLRSFRSLGGMIILYYGLTSLIAAALGTITALVVKPGQGAAGLLALGEEIQVQATDFNLIDNLVSWFPDNPIKAMTEGHMLQIIVFAIIVGLGLLAMGGKARSLVKFFNDGAELMITITEFVMKTAPYGILALVANMVATLGTDMLAEVGRFLVADYVTLLLLLVVFYPGLLLLLGKLAPLRFYRNIAPAMLVAGSTTSSSATLPVSMAVADDNLGVPEKVWGFTLPLGATINMNGMAAAIGVIAVFASHLYDVPLTPALLFQFIFLGLALSIGTAGIKGGGIVMSGVLLQTLNMPLTLIPLLASLWPILDIGHTVCNVTGDLVGTSIVSSRLGILDEKVFSGRNRASVNKD
ncbi:MAG: dicarboxylate/amino acid:cation symporter [Candidatus Aminicenantaceae bacterium]